MTNQVDIFDATYVGTAQGITAVFNIRVTTKQTAKYGYPDKSIKTAAKSFAELVSSGDLGMKEAEHELEKLHDEIEHLILKPVNLAKILKAGYAAVKKSLKEKAQETKKRIVSAVKKMANSAGNRQRYKMKGIYQGLMFGEPEQKLHNADGWENITGVLYLNPNKDFTVVDKIAVEA